MRCVSTLAKPFRVVILTALCGALYPVGPAVGAPKGRPARAPRTTVFPPARPAQVSPPARASLPDKGSAPPKVEKAPAPIAVPTPGSPPPILPLSEVRPGMVGEALTVFQGTKPEPFQVRVISIMHQFLPKQDVILIRAEDPRLAFSGIAAGMSGSPVYVGGRLMGAIAYGWSFSKEPLGGVTPIETMLAERARPRRSSRELRTENDREGLRQLTLAEGGPDTPGAASGKRGSDALPNAGATASGGEPGQPHLVRVAVPLSVSGFDPRVLGALSRALGGGAASPEGDGLGGFGALGGLGGIGLVAVQGAGVGGGRASLGGGGTAAANKARTRGGGRLQPGSAVGIELIRGDMSMVGTGTVTYVDHDGVLAFGHPMFGAGEIYLPLVEAEIHAILPSVSQSMKLSSPLREVGALVQDRQSCVVGDLGARATMVPVTVRITGPGAEPRVFRAEVARNRRLTPTLASLVVSNALVDAEPDVAEMVVKTISTIRIRGREPIELRDEVFAPEGVSRQSLAGTRGMRAVSDLLSNPFQPVILERLDVDVRVEYRRDVAEIVAVSLPGDEVRAGETVRLRVTLRPYDGPEYTETIPVVIPRMLAGSTTRIEVASGSVAKPDTAPAESLSTYMDNLGRYFAPMSIVVGVQTPDDGAALHGRLLADLPAAAVDTLRPGNQTRRADAFRVVDRTVHPTKRLVTGRQEITVYVRDDVLGSESSSPRLR